STIETLLPGQDPPGAASPEVARLLGDERMAEALSAHLTGLQGASGPQGHVVTWDGDEVMIDRETIALCTDRAQKLDRHHNLAREIFVEQMLDELTDLVMGLDAQMLRDVEEGFEDEVRRVVGRARGGRRWRWGIFEEWVAAVRRPARAPLALAAGEGGGVGRGGGVRPQPAAAAPWAGGRAVLRLLAQEFALGVGREAHF